MMTFAYYSPIEVFKHDPQGYRVHPVIASLTINLLVWPDHQ